MTALADPRAFADELDRALERHVLAPRLPGAIDRERFGFRAVYDAAWAPREETHRPLVFHARLSWTAAFVAELRPQLAPPLLEVARHGLAGLAERFWDAEHGGFRFRLPLDERPDPANWSGKALYAQAFGLLAAARLARLAPADLDREQALALAERTFDWIESRLRGAPDRPGYLTAVWLDGSPLPVDLESVTPPGVSVFPPPHWHDQNSHLHLLEAYTELYRVAPRPRVGERLGALLDLFLDRFLAEPGCLHMMLDADGRPVPGPVSFGHDLEASFLLADAADVLGRGDEPRLVRAARRLALHALTFGWDPHLGVWTELGGARERSRDLLCGWWVPLEALNACSALADRLPEERERFTSAMADTWRFLVERLIDDERGGFWQGFEASGELVRIKSEAWFSTYHAARTLVLTADRLRAAAAPDAG